MLRQWLQLILTYFDQFFSCELRRELQSAWPTLLQQYDPTAGTGGMLSVAEDHLSRQNADARLVMFGQELYGEPYAICKVGIQNTADGL